MRLAAVLAKTSASELKRTVAEVELQKIFDNALERRRMKESMVTVGDISRADLTRREKVTAAIAK